MTVEFVNAGNRDFRALAAELDAYYFSLVGDVQNRYAEPNRPENMDALVVAYQDEKAVAIGAWKRREGNTAEMKRIYVCPEYRRKGIAKAILQTLEDHSAFHGCRRWILETARTTDASHRLYLSLGYRIAEYYGSPAGEDNCLCFIKE